MCAASCIDALQAASRADGTLLASVSVQFPDPWPKTRHRKRRIVQTPLVQQLVERLKPGGFVFLQSDVEEVALEMQAAFAADPRLVERADLREAGSFWLAEAYRPFPDVKTERERQADRRGLQVFRSLFIRAVDGQGGGET